MSTIRLTDAHRARMVEQYRAGTHSSDLARQFGCSPNTVMRAVRAAIRKDELLKLKARYRTRARPNESATPTLVAAPAAAKTAPKKARVSRASGSRVVTTAPPAQGSILPATSAGDDPLMVPPVAEEDLTRAVLPLDDADDFTADGDDDISIDDDDTTATAADAAPVTGKAAPAKANVQTLSPAVLPGALYMLVERSVELQPQPLGTMAALGPLSAGEQARHGLTLFTNPRQARRQCGRQQKVIKLPDAQMLLRTAPFLRAKGISRLVIEGNLYALPGDP